MLPFLESSSSLGSVAVCSSLSSSSKESFLLSREMDSTDLGDYSITIKGVNFSVLRVKVSLATFLQSPWSGLIVGVDPDFLSEGYLIILILFLTCSFTA